MKPERENNLYNEICSILEEARRSSYRAVNAAMVRAYWQIGKRIVEHEQGGHAKANYGEGLLKDLARRLTIEFGKGFSVSNLENFRKFYLTFPSQKTDAPRRNSERAGNSAVLRAELSWTHYRLLMRVENEQARTYYMEETIAQNWSTRALERQINSFYYERLVSSKNKEAVRAEAKEATGALAPRAGRFYKGPLCAGISRPAFG